MQECNTTKSFFYYLRRVLYFLPSIFLLSTIFSFSAQTGTSSSLMSEKITSYIVNTYDSLFHLECSTSELLTYYDLLHLLVRKTAHVSEYFLLCLSLLFPFSTILKKKRSKLLTSGLLSVLFASLDEFHQTFISGRMGTMRDVFIDSIGIILAIIVYSVCSSMIKRKKENKSKSILY